MREQHNCPVQADSGQTCNVQSVFYKQTQRTAYCGRVVKGNDIEGFFRFHLEQPQMPDSPKFAHRLNLDGTTDSICFRCIATVATAHDEGELLRYEHHHTCDPVLVERFDGTKPPSSESVADPANSMPRYWLVETVSKLGFRKRFSRLLRVGNRLTGRY